jgi:hypothetical protein
MLKDYCGKIYSIDNINELPNPIPEGILYFVNDTKEIIGNMGNGFTRFSNTLINKPNLWLPNIEYDFGDNVYGKRITGSYNSTSTTLTTVVDNIAVINSIIDQGGTSRVSNKFFPIGGYSDFYLEFVAYSDNILKLEAFWNANFSYNAWVKYMK